MSDQRGGQERRGCFIPLTNFGAGLFDISRRRQTNDKKKTQIEFNFVRLYIKIHKSFKIRLLLNNLRRHILLNAYACVGAHLIPCPFGRFGQK